MELQLFKEKFMHSAGKLEEKLDAIRDVLLSEGEEAESKESWAEYNWPQFHKTALDHIRELARDADKVYHFVVEDEYPCAIESGEQITYESELFRDLHDLLDCIEAIAYDFGYTFEKLTGDCLKRTENKNSQDNISSLAAYIIEELDLLVENASYILEYLTDNGCCESNARK